MPRSDYGIDAPKLVKRFALRGGLLVAFAAVLYLANRNSSPGGATALASMLISIGLTFMIVAAIMVWSSRVAKLKVRDRILDSLPWRGDESVLDISAARAVCCSSARHSSSRPAAAGGSTGVDSPILPTLLVRKSRIVLEWFR
jgi:hypothetical protein